MNQFEVIMADSSDTSEVLNRLRENDIEGLTSDHIEQVLAKANEIVGYKPRVGILGKTGVGKSSLCNAIFGEEIAEVSDVDACTREPEEFLLSLDEESQITLVDVPGVGENRERDIEYANLYKKLLPKLDLVIWVLKADDRAYSTEETFYEDVVSPGLGNSPFLIALNQVDKIKPLREWNLEMNRPGPNQHENITKKVSSVSDTFGVPSSDVVPISSSEGYGLVDLVYRVVFRLPDEKKFAFERKVSRKHSSEETKEEARKGFFSSLRKKLTEIWKRDGDKIVEGAIRAVWKIITRRR